MTDTTPADERDALLLKAWRWHTEGEDTAVHPMYIKAFYAGWQARATLLLDNELAAIEGRHLEKARAASQPAQEPDNDKVICPNCCHQFRAIPVNVQQILLNLGCEPPFMGTPEPAQEPVAYVNLGLWSDGSYWPDDCFSDKPSDGCVPLYAAPPATQQAEPCATCENLLQSLRMLRVAIKVGMPEYGWDDWMDIIDTALSKHSEPAPGYCKHCKQYTIAEPLPADEEAVRLLREARGMIDATSVVFDWKHGGEQLCIAIDAYLAKASP